MPMAKFVKEDWDVEEFEKKNLGVVGLSIFQRLQVVYIHKDNENIVFERVRTIWDEDLYYAQDPEALVRHILDEMHSEIQDAIMHTLQHKGEHHA